MYKDLNLADVRAFTVIAEQGSFTLAAEQLACSRSHLSKQLTQLESYLGVTLITRTTRAQRLTDQGEFFYERCQHALDVVEQAVAQTVDNAQNLQGNININCVGGYIGEEVVTRLVNDFMSAQPNISINLDFSSQRVDLVLDHFDLVFRMGELEDSGLVARKLMDINNCTLAAPGYLEQKGKPLHPKALNEHSCIIGTVNHWSFLQKEDVKQKTDVAITGKFRCKNGRVMKSSALAGQGIVRLPEIYCIDELSKGELVHVFDDWMIPATPLYLLYNKDKFQPARLREFISFTTAHFNDYV
ncbi:LysR family transcriptional regulator [Shewanella sp. Choline-02u-19]|uniref:LysR family transcriptional regulator n=1 Tax=unclassified Shewanella TaxID=196818 RepID=UPI000C331622|nr:MULTISPECIES: LysR family transcriptional regulator [unclassified Shewanella]PKH60345.1 LysR family transcriptional regulator [Shewanella sp. Bg11-22]PKI29848.1 LysR family transcriptional regulator [Shewanella sp. Choline-02u-19]